MKKMESEVCGPGCNCSTSPTGSKAKIVVGLIVLLIAVSILAYKMIHPRPVVANVPTSGYAIGIDQQNSESSAEENRTSEDAPVSAVTEKVCIGDYIDSFGALNKVAVNQDAVFILIPAKKDEIIKTETDKAMLAAQRTLKTNGIDIGLYTLENSAADHSSIAKQVTLPAILVACKGRGMAVVSGDVTETKLLQAFTASSSAGGCGPSGCGPSNAGCN